MPRADQPVKHPRVRVRAPGVPPVQVLNPDVHIRLAAQFVATAEDFKSPTGEIIPGHHAFGTADLPYVRFVSFWDATDDDLDLCVRLIDWWLHQMTFVQAVKPLREVPGSEGRLFWLDMRHKGWNAIAWQAVAEREFYLVEPGIDHQQAEYLRQKVCAPVSAAAKEGRRIAAPGGQTKVQLILPAEAIVSGRQLLRDTFETDRVDSYYDLLFARQRFGDREWWPGGPWNGKDYSPGWYRKKDSGFVHKNFPRDVNDWDKAFGIDVIRDFGRSSKVDLDFGGVVEGGQDNPRSGSAVSLHNRLVVTFQGPFGGASRTFDVLETSGVRDYSESLIFAGQKFIKGEGAKAVFDAGELLYYLPNGGQAGLLINAQGKRIEAAANNVALDGADTGMDKRVRNMGSCLECHAPAGGYILPRDLVSEGMQQGISYKFKNPEQLDRLLGFVKIYKKRVEGYQGPYLDLLAELTKGRGEDKAPGWNGAQVGKQVEHLRRSYDLPLDLDAAAREMGMPPDALKRFLAKSPFNRANQLLHGRPVPRRVWERDLYPNLQILRAAEVDYQK
jgi:hypothetical protein